jgi:hypothetical protein
MYQQQAQANQANPAEPTAEQPKAEEGPAPVEGEFEEKK